MIQLEHRFEGPFNVGVYDLTLPNGRKAAIRGKAASLLSLILSGYQLRDDFQPLDAFAQDSLETGRAYRKVVSRDVRGEAEEASAG